MKRLVLRLAAPLVIGLAAFAVDGARYEMDVTVDYGRGTFSGRVVVEYRNAACVELAELFFRFYPNGSAIYGDARVEATEVLVDGSPVAAEACVADTALYVPLPAPLAPGATATVSIAFQGAAHITAASAGSPGYGLLTKTDHAMTLTAFYPILALYGPNGWRIDPPADHGDALMSEASTYEVRLVVPAGIAPATSGTACAPPESADGMVAHRFRIEAARDFSAVLLDGHVCRETDVEGITIRTWFSPPSDRASQIALDRAANALTLYTERIARPPFDEIDLVEVPMWNAGGMEFSGLILISSAYARTPDDPFYEVIVSHEIAHQWFYAGVGNDVAQAPWLDEAFATYLSYLYFETYVGADAASQLVENWARSYRNARNEAPFASVDSPIQAFPSPSAYSGLVYSGGALFLHAVREAIGDPAFFSAISSYYAGQLGRIATAADLLGAFEASCACRIDAISEAFGLAR